MTASALAQARVLNNLHTVPDCAEALEFLRREGKYLAAPRTDLLLFDVSLPGAGAGELLRELRSDPRLQAIPVIGLVDGAEDETLAHAWGLDPRCVIHKPFGLRELATSLSSFEHFWVEVVTLPPPPPADERRSEPPPTPALLPAETTRVLLIEDNVSDSRLLTTALESSERLRFEVTTAQRMDEAERLLGEMTFDVIVSDLGLPDCEGIDAVRRLREAERFVPIIVLTGRDADELGVLAMRAGAQDFVTKGTTPWRLVVRTVTHAVERARLEAQLRHAQRAEAVGQLAAGIAHDFNNILAVIRGHVGLMAEEETSEAIKSSIEEIGLAVGRASNLTRQLLTFTRQQPFQRRWLDCNAVVGDLYKMLRRVIGEDIHIELQLTSPIPAVFADIGMLEQVLMNLAINARDAMPGRGKLTLRTTAKDFTNVPRLNARAKPGRYVCLSVIDTGTGIAPEHLPRIFDPYFTTKEQGRGTGLGLATVQSIVNQHDGWIEVQSTLRGGARFDVYLPAGLAPARSSQPPERVTPCPGKGETILLVEDEPALRSVVSAALRRHGYRVLAAEHAVEVLENWERWRSDVALVVTDIVMPSGMSGLELVGQLRAWSPELPFLCVSGYAPEHHGTNFSLVEGDNFFQKPYEIPVLTAAIQRLLSRSAPPRGFGELDA